MTDEVSDVDVGEQTLKQTPERALVFLRGYGTNDMIRAILGQVGYSEKDHEEGWQLLKACSGYGAPAGFAPSTPMVAEAIKEIDAWDEPGFKIISATLGRHYPAQAAYVMDGLTPAQGVASVLGVSMLLSRLDDLQHSPERKATRKEDAAALELLAARGITPEKRKHLAEQVKVAQSAQPTKADPVAVEKRAKEQLDALVRLRSWYAEWAEVARAHVNRRDYLIALGLASRRTGGKPEPVPNGTGGNDGTVTPNPPPAA